MRRRLILLCLLGFTMCVLCGCQWMIDRDLLPGDGTTTFPDSDATTMSDEADKTENHVPAYTDVNELRTDYQLGSCQDLSGNVAVILFFMDDFESSWTLEEADKYIVEEVKPGLEFLEQQAGVHGVELNLTVAQTYVSMYYNDEVITSMALTGMVTIDTVKQAAYQLGYSYSDEALLADQMQEFQADEIVYLTVFHKNGTAYAINPKREAEFDVVEHCVLFAWDLYSDGNDPGGAQASVVAHEILHLYGAEDFYTPYSRKTLASFVYPDDIMLRTAYDIRENQLGDTTAFYIGWSDEVPDVILKPWW